VRVTIELTAHSVHHCPRSGCVHGGPSIGDPSLRRMTLARAPLAVVGDGTHGLGAMRSALAILALTAALAACSGARPVPADARTTVVSLTKIDCSGCGDQIVADLRERPGIYDAELDRRKAEVRVLASPTFDVLTAVREGAARKEFDALLGAGSTGSRAMGQSPAVPGGAPSSTRPVGR
jgi:hypothetical protein